MCCACGGGYNNSETLVSGCKLTEVKTRQWRGATVAGTAHSVGLECRRVVVAALALTRCIEAALVAGAISRLVFAVGV